MSCSGAVWLCRPSDLLMRSKAKQSRACGKQCVPCRAIYVQRMVLSGGEWWWHDAVSGVDASRQAYSV